MQNGRKGMFLKNASLFRSLGFFFHTDVLWSGILFLSVLLKVKLTQVSENYMASSLFENRLFLKSGLVNDVFEPGHI